MNGIDGLDCVFGIVGLQRSNSSVHELAKMLVDKKRIPDIIGMFSCVDDFCTLFQHRNI